MVDEITDRYMNEWVPIAHGSIGHEPFTALEQWKVLRHRLL